MNIPEEIKITLTDEQKKKIEAAQSPEELMAVAKEEGYELSDEQLVSLAGGKNWFEPSIIWSRRNEQDHETN